MRTILCLALAVFLPVAVSAKGGHGGHARRAAPPAADSPGAMMNHGAGSTSGESRPFNASAKADASTAAKAAPARK